MSKRPIVNIKCPAAIYEGPGERIVEIWDPVHKQGCLLSVRSLDNGTTVVIPYRADPKVVVHMHGRQYKVAR